MFERESQDSRDITSRDVRLTNVRPRIGACQSVFDLHDQERPFTTQSVLSLRLSVQSNDCYMHERLDGLYQTTSCGRINFEMLANKLRLEVRSANRSCSGEAAEYTQ